ncbi:hypothetical protein N7495_000046 [Penicillium taxi]|uniref:uncharacterized protein n=1 Tax=Penicillium taxi TaxID=168475 RepID=UPI002544F6CA|nr:uncharacterized protein N7495_000046 [Penicillium taxi]KAJ5907364.1 hypothetical protein N7495_000046 [Penicillium taxi]
MPSDLVQQLPYAEPLFFHTCFAIKLPATVSSVYSQKTTPGYLTVKFGEVRDHKIQAYSDIDGRWTGQGERCIYDFEVHAGLALHLLSAEDAGQYTEESEMALWGQAVLASRSSDFSTISVPAGDIQIVRNQFVKQGD